jgi:hypothetical protein
MTGSGKEQREREVQRRMGNREDGREKEIQSTKTQIRSGVRDPDFRGSTIFFTITKIVTDGISWRVKLRTKWYYMRI